MRWPLNASLPEVVESNGDSTVALTERRADIHMQARDRRSLDSISCVVGQQSQTLISGRQDPGQELAFRSIQLQSEDQVAPALPTIVCQERCACNQISECRGVSGRSFGAPACNQVEPGQLLAFLR